MSLEALDALILEFDRSDRFHLVEAIGRTTRRLTALRPMALGLREAMGATAAPAPGVPRKLVQCLVRGTFIRDIHGKAVLDLHK